MKTSENISGQFRFQFTEEEKKQIESKLHEEIKEDKQVYFVIDDDPTGGQTVHNVPVFTCWDIQTMQKAVQLKSRLVFIMTNSRSMTAEGTKKIHRELLKNLAKASEESGISYSIISRGDSTLRGHYPLEADLIREQIGGKVKELLIPMFPEGERYTVNDCHYLKENGCLVLCTESDYCRDKTFGYCHANLKEWIEEKTKGQYPAKAVASVSLDMIHNKDYEGIYEILRNPANEKIIVNGISYDDLKVFAIGYLKAVKNGGCFIARTAAAWPCVIGGETGAGCIGEEVFKNGKHTNGGLIIVGSHVQKTTRQLNYLMEHCKDLDGIEFNQHLVVDEKLLQQEIRRIADNAERLIAAGRTVVIFTRRERLDVEKEDGEAQLAMTNRIADSITEIVKRIKARPGFLISKGGITSSDILTKALHTKEAVIYGQIYPGIPVWKLGESSKYPGMLQVIFPGNVGQENTLMQITEKLM